MPHKKTRIVLTALAAAALAGLAHTAVAGNTVPPSIPTTGHPGDLVTCNPGTWTGSPTFTFAWTRDGVAIVGQTAQTYTLADEDAGHAIRCEVTGHDVGGDSGPVASNALTVTVAPPANTVPPSIPASGHPGDQVTCIPGTWSGSPTFTFAWTRDGTVIAGEAAQTYTLLDADLGHQVGCRVTGHNAGGDSAPADSNALSVVAVPPANSGPPAIPSSGHPGDVVTCDAGVWTGSPTFTFAWTRDGTVIASGISYTLTSADVGHVIRCSVTAHNSGGDVGPVDSNALTATILAPASTAAPSIPSSGHAGDQITCNPGTWTGSPTFSFAWTRDDSVITGQTGQMYTLAAADATHVIRCRVTAHNAGGDSAPVDSNALNALVALPANTTAPSIPSSGRPGDRITCNPGTWTGSPTFAYAWLRNDVVLAGRTSAAYTLTSNDVSQQIRCRVTGHNAGGDGTPVKSNVLLVTTGAPPPGKCAICILGPSTRTNLTTSGSGSITARGGALLINGRVRLTGSGRVSAPTIAIYPKAVSHSNFSKKPVGLARRVADPLASRTAPFVGARCENVKQTSESITLGPGVYCGLSKSTGTVTLRPGLFVFTGSVRLGGNSALRGSGATIFLAAHGTLELSSHAKLDVSAPGSGRYHGVGIFFDRNNAAGVSLSGDATAAVDGAVYGKSASLRLVGSAALTCTESPLAIGKLLRSGRSRVLVRPGV